MRRTTSALLVVALCLTPFLDAQDPPAGPPPEPPPAARIEPSTDLKLFSGGSLQLTAQPASISFSWSATGGVEVDSAGKVTAYQPGKATVRIDGSALVNGNWTALSHQVDVTVLEPELKLQAGAQRLLIGESTSVGAMASPDEGKGQWVNWQVVRLYGGANPAELSLFQEFATLGLVLPTQPTLTAREWGAVKVRATYWVQCPSDAAKSWSKTVELAEPIVLVETAPEVHIQGAEWASLLPGAKLQLSVWQSQWREPIHFTWKAEPGADGGLLEVDPSGLVTGWQPGTASVTVEATVMVNGQPTRISDTAQVQIQKPNLFLDASPTEIELVATPDNLLKGKELTAMAFAMLETGRWIDWKVVNLEGEPDMRMVAANDSDPGDAPTALISYATFSVHGWGQASVSATFVIEHPTDPQKSFRQTVSLAKPIQIKQVAPDAGIEKDPEPPPQPPDGGDPDGGGTPPESIEPPQTLPQIVVDGAVVLYPGTTAQLRASPSDLSFTWSSSEGADGGFAEVDQTGNVIGYLPGTSPVTVSATVSVNGEMVEVSKTVELTVSEPVLRLTDPTGIVYEGHDYQVDAQVDNGMGQTENFTNWRVLGSNAATATAGAPAAGAGGLPPVPDPGSMGTWTPYPGPFDPWAYGFSQFGPPPTTALSTPGTLTTLRPGEVRVAVDYVVQHPSNAARNYSKTVQTLNAIEIRPISSQVSGTTYVDMNPSTGDPNAPPVANTPTLSVAITPGDAHGTIVAWYINDRRYTPGMTMTGSPISYPQEQVASAAPGWSMPPVSSDPTVWASMPAPGTSTQPMDMPTRTIFFTFTGQDCDFVCVRPVFCCGTVTRAADNTLEITVVDSTAVAPTVPVSPGGDTGTVTPPPPLPVMPTVSIRGTLIQWARVGATATTPRPTDTKFVVTEGTTLTVQATTVAPSTSSTQTGTAQTPATPAFTYTWCHSPPNPLIEASPATPTGTTTPSATTGNADPLQFLSGQGTNTAQFKFNKPGKYTVSCRIVGQDRCLGLSASSLPITVWVPRVDWDVDVNDDGQFTADEEALETDPVGIPMPVITLPADDTASSQNSGPAPLVYSNRIVLRRIYPNDVPRSLVKLKRNGGDFRIVRPDGTEVLQRGAAESADLWNDISGGDTNLLLQALDTQRFTLTLEYANDTPSSP